jgi:endonuclease YncB( thermonuclease family)
MAVLVGLGFAGTARLEPVTAPRPKPKIQATPPPAAPALPGEDRVDPTRLACTVERVVDGDTLDARCAGEKHRVRLLRVNTPERGKPGYREASRALSEIVGTGPIALDFETPGELQRDGFGRVLAYVYRGDRLANLEIVRQGWSTFWTRYGAGRLNAQFGRAEREARAAGAGLWDAKRYKSPPPDAKPEVSELPPVGECRARSSCCRVCSAGQACGDGCIGAGSQCSREPGCACSARDVCP